MPVFTDQAGQKVAIDIKPRKIVSLVPSQTELLYYLGLDKEVCGITKFCTHPAVWLQYKTIIGGTKTIKTGSIHQLKPDLIIANKEENVKEQIEELATQYPVWTSDVNNLADAYAMIEQVGIITGKYENSLELVEKIKSVFSVTENKFRLQSACYLIWQKPYMTVGGDTFISNMMSIAGFENVFAKNKRYPEITIKDIKAKNPEVILLPSEPFPFSNKHAEELKTHFPGTAIILVDGELFSWYGSRMLHAAGYFINLRQHGFH